MERLSTTLRFRMFISQLVKYGIAGFVAFIVDVSILYTLTEYAGINYLVSAVFAFSVGMVIVYLLSVQWVFKKRKFKNRHHEFWIFVLIGIVGLVLNELIIFLFTEYFAFYYLISKVIATVIVYFWNFFNRKYLLFN
jgi:putative flippase GtrA